MQAPYNAE